MRRTRQFTALAVIGLLVGCISDARKSTVVVLGPPIPITTDSLRAAFSYGDTITVETSDERKVVQLAVREVTDTHVGGVGGVSVEIININKIEYRVPSPGIFDRKNRSLKDIPPFTAATLIVQDDRTSYGQVQGSGERAVMGAAVGTGVGTAVGLAAAASCAAPGLGTPVCVVYMVVMGMGSGAVAGSFYGFSGTSKSDRALLSSWFADVAAEEKFHEVLVQELVSRSPDMWTVDGGSTVDVVAALRQIEFSQKLGGRLGIKFESSLALVWLGEDGQVATHQVDFEASTRSLTIEEWVSDEGLKLAEATLSAAKRTANEMADRIGAIATRRVTKDR